jgi:hypothetical protein
MLSNILLKSSFEPRVKFVSGSLGGVAVLSVLPVTGRVFAASGVSCRGTTGADDFEKRPPKEKVLPAARRAPESGDGSGISWILECGDWVSSGGGTSVDDGRVDDELNLVDVELS